MIFQRGLNHKIFKYIRRLGTVYTTISNHY